MNKILLIVQREFLNRVQKKSFLIATILIPLIFPSIIGILVYVKNKQDEGAEKQIIHYVDESGTFVTDSLQFIFKSDPGPLADAKTRFEKTDDLALLYIPAYDIKNR